MKKLMMMAMVATTMVGAAQAGEPVQLWKDGPYWAECNVGATKPEEYGYYFWWGDTVGYTNTGSAWISVKDGTTTISFSESSSPANSTYGKNNATLLAEGYIDSTGNLVAEHDAATAHLGDPWRMPTDAEFVNLTNKCSWAWTDNWNGTGVAGCVVTGKEAGYTDKSIFLPAAGFGGGASLYTGTYGSCWSSTPYSDDSDNAWYLLINSSNIARYGGDRYSGRPVRPVYVPPPDYLTFTAEEDGSTVTFKWASGKDVMINTNGTWVAYSKNTTITLAKAGDKVMFKGNGVTTAYGKNFSMTGKIAASGDVGTLTDGKGGADVTLSEECYVSMFASCTSLTTAPELPATQLEQRCYGGMFYGCASLTAAPKLPATQLAQSCYSAMFQGCTSLTTAPELPAMQLMQMCYGCMFQDCTSLTTAPKLPATQLANSCYYYMFFNCTAMKVNQEAPGAEWSIPMEVTGDESGWNAYMFSYNRGTIPSSPSKGVTYYVVPTVAFTPIEVENATWEIFEDNSAWTLKGKVHTNATIKVRYTAKDGLAFDDGSYVKTVYVGKADADPFAPTGYAPAAPQEWTQATASTTVNIDTRTDKLYFDADDILPVWMAQDHWGVATNTSTASDSKAFASAATTNWFGWKPAYFGKYKLEDWGYNEAWEEEVVQTAYVTYTTPVKVTTNDMAVAGATAVAMVDGAALPEDGIVASNSTVKVVYTVTAGDDYYFNDGSKVYEATFTATGAENEAGAMIAKPTTGKPKVQLGVVAQRYPWDGKLDVQYKALYVPAETYKLKVTVTVDGVAKEATTDTTITSGISTFVYDTKANFGEVKTKNCKVTAKLVTAE